MARWSPSTKPGKTEATGPPHEFALQTMIAGIVCQEFVNMAGFFPVDFDVVWVLGSSTNNSKQKPCLRLFNIAHFLVFFAMIIVPRSSGRSGG